MNTTGNCVFIESICCKLFNPVPSVRQASASPPASVTDNQFPLHDKKKQMGYKDIYSMQLTTILEHDTNTYYHLNSRNT